MSAFGQVTIPLTERLDLIFELNTCIKRHEGIMAFVNEYHGVLIYLSIGVSALLSAIGETGKKTRPNQLRKDARSQPRY